MRYNVGQSRREGAVVDREKLVLGLQSLLSGTGTPQQFEAAFRSELLGSPDYVAVWANLEHYLADGDIRAKDDRYRSMQDEAMRELIRLVGEGASAGQLAEVTFLR